MAAHRILSSTSNSDMKRFGAKALRWIVFTACFVVTIEAASRVDQWMAYGAPILGVYTYDSALFVLDEFGIRGKPNGRYEKWSLNSMGFRGDEITLERTAGQDRVICIGASETFGLYEAAGNEWPRRLEQVLRQEGAPTEVINAAIAGMSLPQRTRHLTSRLLRLRSDVVVMMLEYGSYAGLTRENVQVRRQSHAVLSDTSGIMVGLKSLRMISRVKDIVLPKFPAPIREMVVNMERTFRTNLVKQQLGAQYRSFVQVQPFEIDMFRSDLEELAAVTREAGVTLILTSPAMWFTDRNVAAMYLSWPYVDESWWRQAQTIFSDVAKTFAQSHDIAYLDLSESVHGNEESLMTDFLHFNDRGADVVGRRIAQQMLEKRASATSPVSPVGRMSAMSEGFY